ncbi:MAG: alpha/beta fold hydrolase [Candidatus Diapherotrites archaeon]|nr:alpha/beta fold hydrolase [Candidatus Diapherotrites archaeon]
MIDGRLAFVLDRPKKKTNKCVVLAHGFTGSKDEDHNFFVKLSKALVKEGFAVLRFDFTGQGESPGLHPKISLGSISSQARDLTTALDFAATKYSRIGLLGLSFGACTAVHTHHPWVRALVLMSGFSYPYSLFPLQFPLDWWAGRKIKAPVLVVTAEKDKTVPPLSQKMMYWMLPEPKKFVLVEGGGHTFAPASKEDEPKRPEEKAIAVSVEWLKKWL